MDQQHRERIARTQARLLRERYPYEVHILPREIRPAISDFNEEERTALAAIMKVVMEKYNNPLGLAYVLFACQGAHVQLKSARGAP